MVPCLGLMIALLGACSLLHVALLFRARAADFFPTSFEILDGWIGLRTRHDACCPSLQPVTFKDLFNPKTLDAV
jgi:hypothetical protein